MPSLNFRLVCGVVVAVILITADQRSHYLHRLRAALSVLVYPVQALVAIPFGLGQKALKSASSYLSLREENRHLRHEQLISQAKLLKFDSLEKENIRLRALLETSFKLDENVLVTELLSVRLPPPEHIVLVDKGSRFGVYQGQPVLDANGIVGQVLRVNPFNSEIMLISDPNHAIPVELIRNGLRTIAVGSGGVNRLVLPYLPNNSDIKVGDLVVSSGLGGTFPHGYPVGIVRSVSPRPDRAFSEVSVKTAAELDRSRELLLVWFESNSIPLGPIEKGEPKHTENGKDDG